MCAASCLKHSASSSPRSYDWKTDTAKTRIAERALRVYCRLQNEVGKGRAGQKVLKSCVDIGFMEIHSMDMWG